ncbi:disks large homolog 4-like isoform X4 [Lates japonicus]|uniref:Disks large homolog 4-like isoform X4 n=1 Tax=Lates japonicus TaxID=270547 RepID=A0AAD3RFI8_LATJO|nr:disks large homolog 4-like isoform X4 [Lates japonicus]
MFVSVWYAKKMGRRFINNVRRAKRHRQRMMVGTEGPAQYRSSLDCDWLGEGEGASAWTNHVVRRLFSDCFSDCSSGATFRSK